MDRPLLNCEIGIRDNTWLIDLEDGAKAMAFLAGAMGGIKREAPRLDCGDRELRVIVTHKCFAVLCFDSVLRLGSSASSLSMTSFLIFLCDIHNHDSSTPFLQCEFHGISEA